MATLCGARLPRVCSLLPAWTLEIQSRYLSASIGTSLQVQMRDASGLLRDHAGAQRAVWCRLLLAVEYPHHHAIQHAGTGALPSLGRSSLRAVIDLRAMVNIEDVDNTVILVDPVDNAISAAPGAVTASERPKKRLADPVRVDRQRGIAKFQHGGRNGFRKSLGNRSPGGRLETDLVPLRGCGTMRSGGAVAPRLGARCPTRVHEVACSSGGHGRRDDLLSSGDKCGIVGRG